MSFKQILFLVSCLSFAVHTQAQIGGENAFAISDFQTSARAVAMGGDLISIYDNDVNLPTENPSLLNEKMHQQITFNFVDYFSDINAASVYFATKTNKLGMLHFGVTSMHYGKFVQTNEIGTEIGEFSANEQVFTTGISKPLNKRFTLGINLKLMNSNLENYSSFGIGSNIAISFHQEEKQWCMSLLAKNIGRQITSYTNTQESLPFQIELGISKQLVHLPLRYSITAHHLNKFDISNQYLEPTKTDPLTGNEVKNENSFGKKILRHFVLGAELNPFRKNLFVRGGFNFQRRQDMLVSTRPALVGFSWGIGFKVSKFYFDYSRASYHIAGSTNIFGIHTNLSFFK